MIKYIYFDVGSVIVDNEKARKTIASTYNTSYEAVSAFLEENWKAACLGIVSNTEYMKLLKKTLDITHPGDDITDFFVDHTDAVPQMHEFILEVQERYTIGILSNAERGILSKHIKRGTIPSASWHTIIESAQHGVVKPDKKIFEIAQKKAKVKPHEIFFIDDLAHNIDAARIFGWHGEVFDFHATDASITRIKKQLASL